MSKEIEKLLGRSVENKKVIEILVEYTQEMSKKINKKHKKDLVLRFSDRSTDSTDLFGLVLDVNQRFVKEEWGFPEDDPESYYSLVSRVEVTELEINNGNPKTTIHEYLDDYGQIVSTGAFGVSIKFSPLEYVNYLKDILETGNARLLADDIKYRR